MQIKIVKVGESQKTEGLTLIKGEDGKTYSGFAATKEGTPTGLADLRAGDVIEAEISVNGKYNNIKGFKKTGQQPPQLVTAPAPTSTPEVSGPEHGMALKLVGDLYIGGKLTEDNPLVQKMWAELHRVLGTKR